MKSRQVLSLMVGLTFVTLFGAACGAQQAATPQISSASTPTLAPSAVTSAPSNTPIPSSSTPTQPTPVSPSPTSVPPTATAAPMGGVTLSEEPDKVTLGKYLSNISIGKLPAGAKLGEPDLPTPAAVYVVGDQVCLSMDIIARADGLGARIYDVHAQNYVTSAANVRSIENGSFDKGVLAKGTRIDCGTYPLVAGKYEYKVWVGDVLVAVLPFEVK